MVLQSLEPVCAGGLSFNSGIIVYDRVEYIYSLLVVKKLVQNFGWVTVLLQEQSWSLELI